MANLFKGFKQVKGSTYKKLYDAAIAEGASLKEKEAIQGYIWFVRTPKNGVDNSGAPITGEEDNKLINDSYDIYFGTKHYGHFMEGEISSMATALTNIKTAIGLGDNFNFLPTPPELAEAIKEKSTVTNAINYIFNEFEKYKGTNDGAVAAKAVDIDYIKEGGHFLQLKNAAGEYIGTKIDVADFIYDGILEDAKLVIVKDNKEDGSESVIEGQEIADGTYIKLIFKQEGSGLNKQPIYLDVKGLIDVYTCEDGSILVEGNKLSVAKVDTNKTLTTKDITVKGGPLSQLLIDKGINKIDANTNMQALLEKLFFEELWPSASKTKFTEESFSVYFDSIGATLTNSDTTVEVGTKVTASAKTGYAPYHNTPKRNYSGFSSEDGGYGYATSLEGEVKSGNPASVSSTGFAAKEGTFKMTRSIIKGFTETDKINKSSENASYSQVSIPAAEDLIVNAGENSIKYTISGPGFTGNIPAEEGEYFAASNVGNLSDEHKIARGAIKSLDANPIEKSQTLKVTGKRYAFIGQKNEAVKAIDGATVRTLTPKQTLAANFDMTIENGARRVYICLPSSWNMTLVSVKDVNAVGAEIGGKFLPTTVAVEGANGYEAEDYTVYCYAPDTVLEADTYKVTLK